MTRKYFTQKIIHEAALKLKRAIEADPLTRASIVELIPDNDIARNRLSLTFREITGTNYKGYQRKMRIEKASLMLLSEMTVKEVAIECGYSHVGNFSRDFKLIFEKGPDEWIREKQLNNGNEHTARRMQK